LINCLACLSERLPVVDTSRHELTGANGGEIEISQRSNLDRARRMAYILIQAATTKAKP
jgi:hypothetical protein